MPVTSKNAIEVKNLFFAYNKNKSNIINNVTFNIKRGDYTCIIGHNGSGKSTMSKLIIGILQTTQGTIKINDLLLNSKNYHKIKQEISIVFQNPENQFIGSTVSDDIAFGLENYQVPTAKMPEIIANVAKITGVDKLLNYEPANLSGGQKQRVAIASALALNSKIIIFDEVTSMLDPQGKQEIKNIILELKKDRSKTIISITHDMDEIIHADQILVFNQGALAINGTAKEIFAKAKLLRSISLDIPHILKFSHAMQEAGFNMQDSLYEKEMIKELRTIFTYVKKSS